MRLHKDEQGSILIITLMVLLALTAIGTATVFICGQSNETAVSSRAGDQAMYEADAGVNWGMNYVKLNGLGAAVAGYKTIGFGGVNADVVLLDGSGSSIMIPGPSGAFAASAAVSIGPDPDGRGRSIRCGLVGFSERFGSPRFRVDSIGYGPVSSTRAVEAHVMMAPQEGVCPPGVNVVGGYSGSS